MLTQKSLYKSAPIFGKSLYDTQIIKISRYNSETDSLTPSQQVNKQEVLSNHTFLSVQSIAAVGACIFSSYQCRVIINHVVEINIWIQFYVQFTNKITLIYSAEMLYNKEL